MQNRLLHENVCAHTLAYAVAKAYVYTSALQLLLLLDPPFMYIPCHVLATSGCRNAGACAYNSRGLISVTEDRCRSLIQSQNQLESCIVGSWQPISCVGCALLRLGGRNEDYKCAVVDPTVHQATCLHIKHMHHNVEPNVDSILLTSWLTNTDSHFDPCGLQCTSQIAGNNSTTMLWVTKHNLATCIEQINQSMPSYRP